MPFKSNKSAIFIRIQNPNFEKQSSSLCSLALPAEFYRSARFHISQTETTLLGRSGLTCTLRPSWAGSPCPPGRLTGSSSGIRRPRRSRTPPTPPRSRSRTSRPGLNVVNTCMIIESILFQYSRYRTIWYIGISPTISYLPAAVEGQYILGINVKKPPTCIFLANILATFNQVLHESIQIFHQSQSNFDCLTCCMNRGSTWQSSTFRRSRRCRKRKQWRGRSGLSAPESGSNTPRGWPVAVIVLGTLTPKLPTNCKLNIRNIVLKGRWKIECPVAVALAN